MVIINLANVIFLASALLSTTNATVSSGCGKDLPEAQQPAGGASHQTNFAQSDGTDRTYLIHIPSNYNVNTPVPLIFSFHGGGKTSAEQEELSQFSNEYFNPNGIAVYPQGIDGQWQGVPGVGVNDNGFVQDMINYFNELYCIDTARYYAAGKSDGGGFTGVLACDSSLSTQIAAFAPVSGAFYIPGSTESDCAPQSISLPCSPGRAPLPVIEFHGSNDTTIPYSGGPRKTACLPAVPHWVEEWSIRQEYGLTNKTTSLFGNMVQKYEYGGGNGSLGIVTHYLTDELGHDWPSTVPNDDNPFGTYYNATPIIMDFFNKYTL